MAVGPFHMGQIYRVRHPEIMERTQQPSFDGRREADLCGNMVIEPVEDIFPVHPFRSRRQPQQDFWLEPVEQFLVGLGCRMVEFIYNDHIVKIRLQMVPQGKAVAGLDGHEYLVQVLRTAARHRQFTKIGVLQHLPETGKALLQDFFPMGDEQQPGPFWTAGSKTPVIKGGNGRFPRSCSGYNQVMPAAPFFSFHVQSVQDHLLVGVGTNGKRIGNFAALGCSLVPLLTDGFLELGQVLGGIGLEICRMPIGFKSGIHFGHDFRHVLLGHLHVPFQTIGNGRMGQVGRTHIGRGIPAVPLEQVRLGMEPGFFHVVRNPDFRIGQLGEQFNGLRVRGSHIGGGQHPQMAAGNCKRPEIGEN